MRAVNGLPSFRAQVLYAAFLEAFRGTRRADFRIVEFSVQSNHVHMLVEAEDNSALARGMASFAVRANRLFNAAMGRGRGRVWGERYHRRELGSPREVRNALVYCLNNVRKHRRLTSAEATVDPCSSGPWFVGWATLEPLESPRPTEPPSTFLLEKGWKIHGFLSPTETPRSRP